MQTKCFFLLILLFLSLSNWAIAVPKLLIDVNREGFFDIGIIDADGQNLRMFTNSPKESEGQAQWSPNGRQIAFANSKHIMLMDADGKNVRNFTEPLGLVPAQDAAWPPDGKSLVFTVVEVPDSTTWNIYVANLDGNNVNKLTHVVGKSNQEPAWSPDASEIAYVSIKREGGNLESSRIFVMDASGKNQKQFTKGTDFHPTWSPDGSQIAYLHYQKDNPWQPAFELWVMDADSGNPRHIPVPFNVDAPLWLPDGRILFKKFGQSSETYRKPLASVSLANTVDADGGNLTLLFDLKEVDGTVTVTSWFDPTFAVFPQEKQFITLGKIKEM